jgi:hypothetical protein
MRHDAAAEAGRLLRVLSPFITTIWSVSIRPAMLSNSRSGMDRHRSGQRRALKKFRLRY